MHQDKEFTFWEFIQNHKIEIPIIQRDYAQGRKGKEELRKSFLQDLKAALDAPDKTPPMVLDFVYGTETNGTLQPLDGQQRLTTLWLLHWYIALKAGTLSDNKETLKKLTYETRVSSREFIERLCDYQPSGQKSGDEKTKSLAEDIENQTWFYSEWKQDPTIQAMLTTISGNKDADGLEKAFKDIDLNDDCFKDYWKRLTTTRRIVFHYLPMHDFGLSDDLYIKMNARGKQLTSFENFKADLISYIAQQANKDQWKALNDLESGIAIKMDTTWTDLFWKNNCDGRIDEIYFAFINRFFFNELCLSKANDNTWLVSSDDKNPNTSYEYFNNSREGSDDRKIVYNSLTFYKFFNDEIPLETLERLQKTLDGLHAFLTDYKNKPNELIPQCNWDKDFRFIPEYSKLQDNAGNDIRTITAITQPQRVVFYAICKFFELQDNQQNKNIDEEKTKLKEWLRVVWNLVSVQDANGNPAIRTFNSMRTAMEFVRTLYNQNEQNVYECLNNIKLEGPGNSIFELQCKEEIQKAGKIWNNGSKDEEWENKIIDAENHAFVNGAIRFLFRDNKGNCDWNNFDTKWQNAQRYFGKNGVIYPKNSSISNNEDIPQTKDKRLLRFIINQFSDVAQYQAFKYDNSASSWRQILLEDQLQGPVHQLLTQDATQEIPKLFTVSSQNENLQSLNKDLLESYLLDNIVDGCLLHRYNEIYILYPFNAKRDNIKYIIANKRNYILSSLLEPDAASMDQKIETRQKIDNCDLFWGRNINFKYKENYYQWHENGRVYLMTEDYRAYEIKNENGEENYLCFDTRDINDNTFIANLQELAIKGNGKFNQPQKETVNSETPDSPSLS